VTKTYLLLSLVFLAAGCRDAVTCDCNAGCSCGPSLTCITAVGACAASDPSCVTGQRYDESAGQLANFCVGDGPDLAGTQQDMSASTDDGMMSVNDLSGDMTGAPPPDMTVKCGYAEEACCMAPFVACTTGLACVANKCKVNDVWIVGTYLNIPTSFDRFGESVHWNGTALENGPNFTQVDSLPYALWGDAPGSYKAAGDDGFMWTLSGGVGGQWRFCDGSLGCNRPAGTQQYGAMFGFNMSDFWMGGSQAMFQCGGGNCTAKTTGLPASWGCGQLFGFSSNDLWAAGYSQAMHYVNNTWTTYSIGARGIWGATSNDVWAAGDNLWHWNGSVWSQPQVLPVAGTIYQMAGTAADDIWGLGYNNNGGANNPISIHYDGMSWTSKPFPVASGAQMQKIWAGSKNEAWAVSYNGHIFRWNGTDWILMANPSGLASTSISWVAVWGSAKPRP
jgi:hypothetical protein